MSTIEEKRYIVTDNIEHYISELDTLVSIVKKYRDIASYEIHDEINHCNVNDTQTLYQYIMDDINAIYMAMKHDDDWKRELLIKGE